MLQVYRDPDSGGIKGAEVRNLRNNQKTFIEAKIYVICAGAILTPQLLFNSEFRGHLPALVLSSTSRFFIEILV